MGISFSNLVSDERTVKIDINGNELHVTYEPSRLSPAMFQKMQEKFEDEEDHLTYPRIFCEIVKDWNLEGPIGEGEHAVEAGEKVPVEPEYVAWVPASILQYIIEQIGEDAAPKSKKRRGR